MSKMIGSKDANGWVLPESKLDGSYEYLWSFWVDRIGFNELISGFLEKQIRWVYAPQELFGNSAGDLKAFKSRSVSWKVDILPKRRMERNMKTPSGVLFRTETLAWRCLNIRPQW